MLLIPLFGLLASAASAAAMPVTVHNCTFGEAYAFASTRCVARIDNASDQPLRLRIEPAPRKDSVATTMIAIAANSSAEVPLRVAIGNRTGRVVDYFAVSQEDSDAAPIYLEASGFAMSALDDVRPKVSFGSVEAATHQTKEITLASHDTARFRITRVLDKPKQIDATIAPDGRTLRVRIRPDAAWGVLNGHVKLAIDTPHQKQAWVAVQAAIHGEVVPSGNPVSIGLLDPGREQTLLLTTLRGGEGKKLRIGSIKVEGIDGSVDAVDCDPPAMNCKALHLNVSAKQGAGMVRGKVVVDLPDYRKTLPIDVEGFFMAQQGAQTQEPAESGLPTGGTDELSGQAPLGAKPSSQGSGEPADAHGAQIAESAPPGEGPLLKWNVLDERSVYGYQIFRSDAESGPFVLLNVPAIRAKSNTESGSAYQWRDTSAKKGKTYWYYIGVVHTGGNKQQLSGPQKVVAK